MWDIVWTDPNRELVGEHRAKKKNRRNPDPEPLARTSLSSTASSRSSKSESAFARFRARRSKKPNSKEHFSAVASPASASVSGSTTSARSSVSVTGNLPSSLLSTPASCSRSSNLSSGNARDEPAARATTGTPTDRSSSRLAAGSRSRLARIIGSSTLRQIGAPPSRLQSPVRSAVVEPGLLFPGDPLTPPRSPTDDSASAVPHRPSRSAPRDPRLAHPDPPAKSPLRLRIHPPPLPSSVPLSDRPGAVEAQKMAEQGKSPLASTTPVSLRQFWKPPDVDAYTRDVKAMATASPATVLAKLQELETTSAAAEQPSQVEVERKRWMLSALHHLDASPAPAAGPKARPTQKIAPEKMKNILALYESRESASYLAGFHPTKRICHLSDKPLPMDALPNVQPLFFSTSPSAFPIPPGLFEAVHALSLPSLCSSQDLHDIMQNVRSSLKPGGIFYLVVIDPLPCVGTLGRRLREWLEEHLLVNLERESRCTDPATQLPQWLGEASLRGAGSVLTTVKFYATAENVRRLPRDLDPGIEKLHAERKTKAELRSIIGRMLWCDVWGEYVTTDSWWWDDAACVDECVELGTFWEYHLIEAVKDS